MTSFLSLVASLSLLISSASGVTPDETAMQDCSPPMVYELSTSTCMDFKHMKEKVGNFEDAKELCPAGYNLVSVENEFKMEFLLDQFRRRDEGPNMPSHFWTSAERSTLDQEFYWHYANNITMQVKDYKPFQQPPTSAQNYISVSMVDQPKTFMGVEGSGNNVDLGVICEKRVCPPPPCKNSKCQIVNTDGGCRLCNCPKTCDAKIVEDEAGDVCYTCDCPQDRLCWVRDGVTSEPLLGSNGEVEKCDAQSSCPAPSRCQTSSNTCCVDTDVVCPPQPVCDYRCIYERRDNDVCPKCYCSEFPFPVVFRISISNGMAVTNDTLKDLCSAIEFSTQKTKCGVIPNSCSIFDGKLSSAGSKEYKARVEFEVMTTTLNIKNTVDQCMYIIPGVVSRDAPKELGTVTTGIMFDKFYEVTRNMINTSPCLQPRQKLSCDLGNSFSIRYEYSSTDGTCIPFAYDGCETDHINAFKDKSQCEKKCETDRCYLPIQPGACKALLSRWAYNIDTGRCQEFTYGGCNGNANNFFTEAECMRVCEPVKCQMPLDDGSTACFAHSKMERWYHIKNDYVHECQKKAYSGCLGNTNRFLTKNDCENSCMKELFTTESLTTKETSTKPTPPVIKETTISNEDGTTVEPKPTTQKNDDVSKGGTTDEATKESMTTKNDVEPATNDNKETKDMGDLTEESTRRTTKSSGGEFSDIPDLLPPEKLVADDDETHEPELNTELFTDGHIVTDSEDEPTKEVNPDATTNFEDETTKEVNPDATTNFEDETTKETTPAATTSKPPTKSQRMTTESLMTDDNVITNDDVTANPTPRTTTENRDDTSRKVTDDSEGTGTPADEQVTTKATTKPDDERTKSGTEGDETTTIKLTTNAPVTKSTTRSSGYPNLGEQTEFFKNNDNYCTCQLCGDPLLESFDGYRSAVEGRGRYIMSVNDADNHNQRFALFVDLLQSDPINFPSILTTGVVFFWFRDVELTITANEITMFEDATEMQEATEMQVVPPYRNNNLHIQGDLGGVVWILTADNISLTIDFTDSDNVIVMLSAPRQYIVRDGIDGFCRDCDRKPENDCILYPPYWGRGGDVSDAPADAMTTKSQGDDSTRDTKGDTEGPDNGNEPTEGNEGEKDVCSEPDRYIQMSKHYRMKNTREIIIDW